MGEIKLLIPNLNGFDMWETISNFIPLFTGHMLTSPYDYLASD